MKPTAWDCRRSTYDFLLFLIKLELTTYQVPRVNVESFVRRHKSQYDRSTSDYMSYDTY